MAQSGRTSAATADLSGRHLFETSGSNEASGCYLRYSRTCTAVSMEDASRYAYVGIASRPREELELKGEIGW